MGMARAWLPSRRSTLHQMGAWVRARFGHWRSGKWTGGNGRYLLDGFLSMAVRGLEELNELNTSNGLNSSAESSGFWAIGIHRCSCVVQTGAGGQTKTPPPGPAVGFTKLWSAN